MDGCRTGLTLLRLRRFAWNVVSDWNRAIVREGEGREVASGHFSGRLTELVRH